MSFKSHTFKTLETHQTDVRGLRSVEIGVTSLCNFRCEYCGAYDLLERQVLTPRQVIEMLEKLPDLQRIKLSGGEVLLRFDECVEIIAYCSGRGIGSQVNTNGTLLDEDRFRRLEQAGLDVLHVSLNHSDAARHAKFYRVPERQFEKIVAALRRSVASPSIKTVIETILFNETRDTMLDVHRFAADLGVRHQEIQMEVPSVHAGYASTLDRGTIARAIKELVGARDARVTLYFSCLSAYFAPTDGDWAQVQTTLAQPGNVISSCIEGKSQLHVHSNGDVLICELGCPQVIGNVFRNDLQTIFNESEALQAFLQAKHTDFSFSCFRKCSTPGEKHAPADAPGVP